MKQEDIELLLIDLSARLPYSVKCYSVITNGEPNTIGGYCEVLDNFYIREVGGWFPISIIKPYLRPMLSMTEEELDEYESIKGWKKEYELIDWLNKRHFDYRGLIEKGLALVAPDGMYT